MSHFLKSVSFIKHTQKEYDYLYPHPMKLMGEGYVGFRCAVDHIPWTQFISGAYLPTSLALGHQNKRIYQIYDLRVCISKLKVTGQGETKKKYLGKFWKLYFHILLSVFHITLQWHKSLPFKTMCRIYDPDLYVQGQGHCQVSVK